MKRLGSWRRGFGVIVLAAALLPMLGCPGDNLNINIRRGTLIVSTDTIGSRLDPDGYRLRVVGPSLDVEQTIGIEETVAFEYFGSGQITVELGNVRRTCTVDENPRIVAAILDTTVRADFIITCS